MYNKIKITIAAILLVGTSLFSTHIQAQDGFMYGRISVGYDFRNASSTYVNSTSSGSSYTGTAVPVSFGQGIPICVAGGYMFNKNVGIELGLNYLIGGSYTISDVSNYDLGGANVTTTSTNKYSSSSFQLLPALVISAGMDGVNPYARFGFVIGVANSITDDVNSVSVGGNSSRSESFTDKYSGGMSLGVAAAAGLSFPASDNLRLFVEVSSISMQYTPATRTSTQANSQTITYASSVSNLSPNTTTLQFSNAFSSVGIHIGAIIKF